MVFYGFSRIQGRHGWFTGYEENMPHADIVYDRYHMQAQFGKDVLGVVRLDEAKAHNEQSKRIKESITPDKTFEEKQELKDAAKVESAQYKKLKNARWTLLSNSENLSAVKSGHLKEILNSHISLATCYAMKEEMCRLYECDDIEESERGWKNWFTAAKESGIPALVHFAEIKEKRLPGLINHAKHQISTGKLEGFNNKIKVAKRIGYGYRNDDHFFTLIKFLSIPRAKNPSPRKKVKTKKNRGCRTFRCSSLFRSQQITLSACFYSFLFFRLPASAARIAADAPIRPRYRSALLSSPVNGPILLLSAFPPCFPLGFGVTVFFLYRL